MSLSKRPSSGALEAYSALVHVHALTGNVADGRQAVDGMQANAEALPADPAYSVAGPIQRTASFRNYLECRVGTRQDADRAFAEAEPALRPIPVWLADARIYYSRALVTSGDVTDGITFALKSIKQLNHSVRVVSLGVSDLLSVVPSRHRSDDLDELKTYAASGTPPWEVLV